MGAAMIGVDPHKAWHTAVAISAAEEPLGELRLLAWAAMIALGTRQQQRCHCLTPPALALSGRPWALIRSLPRGTPPGRTGPDA
jgi:hypothetical protein